MNDINKYDISVIKNYRKENHLKDYFEDFIFSLNIQNIRHDYDSFDIFEPEDYQFMIDKLKLHLKKMLNNNKDKDIYDLKKELEQISFRNIDFNFANYVRFYKKLDFVKKWEGYFLSFINHFYKHIIYNLDFNDLFNYYIPKCKYSFLITKYEFKKLERGNILVRNTHKNFLSKDKNIKDLVINVDLLFNNLIKSEFFKQKPEHLRYLLFFFIDFYNHFYNNKDLSVYILELFKEINEKISNLNERYNILRKDEIKIYLADKYNNEMVNLDEMFNDCFNRLLDLYFYYYQHATFITNIKIISSGDNILLDNKKETEIQKDLDRLTILKHHY